MEAHARSLSQMGGVPVACETEVVDGALFVAVKGELQDGHDYLEEVAAKGAVAAIKNLDPTRPVLNHAGAYHGDLVSWEQLDAVADIVVDDEFSSKFHALLMLYSDGLVLLDLNSANGTTVNSVRVKSTLLLDDDIISIGHHRLKVSGVPAEDAGTARRATMADTRRMKNLDKLRSKRKAQLKVVQK